MAAPLSGIMMSAGFVKVAHDAVPVGASLPTEALRNENVVRSDCGVESFTPDSLVPAIAQNATTMIR